MGQRVFVDLFQVAVAVVHVNIVANLPHLVAQRFDVFHFFPFLIPYSLRSLRSLRLIQSIPYFLNAAVLLMPASISLRTNFSPRALARARSMTSASTFFGTKTTPSRSPNTRSPGDTATCPTSMAQR